VIGGNQSVEEESKVISKTNIIIGTPGRVCHHLDQTYGFDLDNILMFVLDEADRMLDMGFKKELDQIISFLPNKRYDAYPIFSSFDFEFRFRVSISSFENSEKVLREVCSSFFENYWKKYRVSRLIGNPSNRKKIG